MRCKWRVPCRRSNAKRYVCSDLMCTLHAWLCFVSYASLLHGLPLMPAADAV